MKWDIRSGLRFGGSVSTDVVDVGPALAESLQDTLDELECHLNNRSGLCPWLEDLNKTLP